MIIRKIKAMLKTVFSSQAVTRQSGIAGFSLIELVVALAIFGLLMAIAIPSYKAYVVRSNRVDAESQLMQMAQAMERYYTANDTYKKSSGSIMTAASLENGAYTYSPATGTPIYTLDLDSTATNTDTYYKLKATPVTGKLNAADGNLTIDSLGAKTWGSATTWNP
jgi:type IV pilus assembly protein PilE